MNNENISPLEKQVLALAGVLGACDLVAQFANTGPQDPESLSPLLEPLVITTPKTVLDVYDGGKGATRGLTVISSVFTTGPANRESLRYAWAILHLERKLAARPALLHTVSKGIDDIKRQRQHMPINDERILAHLSEIYQQSISQIPPRIMVRGQHGYLQQDKIAWSVRALLLAAMRSAILWRQSGGRRWRLLLQRQRLLNTANDLLRRLA